MPDDGVREIEEILNDEPMANVPDDLWNTIYPTWTGLWTDYHGQWDELQASDVYAISDLLSEERLAWLKQRIEALIAAAREDELRRIEEVTGIDTSHGKKFCYYSYDYYKDRLAHLRAQKERER